MHLWHLDDPTNQLYGVDAIATDPIFSPNAIPITLTNFAEPVQLTLPYTNAFFGAESFAPSLNTSYTATTKVHVLYGGTFPDVSQFRNPTSGAFTFEAIIKVNAPFSTADMEILAGDNPGGITTRGWQWRLSNGTMEWNLLAGNGSDNDFKAGLPSTGPDAILTNVWYHAAISYTGQSPTNGDTANILTMYWTLLDGSRTNADVLTNLTASRPLDGSPSGTSGPALGIWGSGRATTGNPGNNEGGIGSIDEVRVSDLALKPYQMAFTNNGQAFPPAFPQQPPAVTLAPYGGTLSINVGVSASSPTLQWYQYTTNSTNVVLNQTNSSLSIPNITFAQGGSYVLVVSNSLNVATSAVAAVTIGASATGLYATGLDTNDQVTADVPDGHWELIESQDPAPYLGPYAMIFEWANPVGLSPGTGGGYSPTNGYSEWIGDQGNPGGNLIGSIAGTYIYRTTFLLDQANPSSITLQSLFAFDGNISNILINGRSTGLSISGTAPLYTEAFSMSNFNNVLYVAATATTTGTTISPSPSFAVTNSTGWFLPGLNTFDIVETITSGASAIYVEDPTAIGQALPPGVPVIVNQPTNQTVRDASLTGPGSLAQFSVVATGRSPLSYQWYADGNELIGDTNRVLDFYNPTNGYQGTNFSVVIANASGSVTSQVAVLAVIPTNQPPVAPTLYQVTYGSLPNNVEISDLVLLLDYDPSGGQLTFDGTFGASTNGNPVSQNNEMLVYSPSEGQVGEDQYNYTVSDSLGDTTTGYVDIENLLNPLPASQVLPLSSTVSYNVGVTNPPSGYTFQWQFNGANISGATTGVLTISNAQAANSGAYVLLATDPTGVQWPSSAADLTIEAFAPYSLPVSTIFDSSEQGGYPATNAVDGTFVDYWVSYGTAAGQEPTTTSPEWLFVEFPRQIAISEFLVYPRAGYGPDNIQLIINSQLAPGMPTNGTETNGIPTNGTTIYTGTMANTAAPLDVVLSKPAYATNAQLYITSSYSTENVQVVQLVFNERSAPGSYGDWELREFTAAQLNNAALTSPYADPDGDGVLNLQEFAVGGNPLVKDATNALMKAFILPGNQVGVQYQVTNNLGDVSLQFEASPDLITWTNVTPTEINVVTNRGTISIEEAVFPQQPPLKFYREDFGYTNVLRN